jgi:hypothetical protein
MTIPWSDLAGDATMISSETQKWMIINGNYKVILAHIPACGSRLDELRAAGLVRNWSPVPASYQPEGVVSLNPGC